MVFGDSLFDFPFSNSDADALAASHYPVGQSTHRFSELVAHRPKLHHLWPKILHQIIREASGAALGWHVVNGFLCSFYGFVCLKSEIWLGLLFHCINLAQTLEGTFPLSHFSKSLRCSSFNCIWVILLQQI